MEEIISKKLDKRWKNIVMDGTKPPIKPCLRKQSHHLIKDKPNHTTTNAMPNTPLVMVFFFEEGGIPIQQPRPRIPKSNNEDIICNLGELYDQKSNDGLLDDQPIDDQPLGDQVLNNKIEKMVLTDNSPSTKTNRPTTDFLLSHDTVMHDTSVQDQSYPKSKNTGRFRQEDT